MWSQKNQNSPQWPPSWPLNHPHIYSLASVSSSPVSCCVVGILAQYGCRRINQVDAAHWWWLRRKKIYIN